MLSRKEEGMFSTLKKWQIMMPNRVSCLGIKICQNQCINHPHFHAMILPVFEIIGQE